MVSFSALLFFFVCVIVLVAIHYYEKHLKNSMVRSRSCLFKREYTMRIGEHFILCVCLKSHIYFVCLETFPPHTIAPRKKNTFLSIIRTIFIMATH